MRVAVLRVALAIAALLTLALPTFADEAITSFDSNTVLKTDGSVDVTETIAVNAEGDRIRHGIFRDIFTVLLNRDGSKFYATLNPLSVTRDGKPEHYEVNSISNGKRLLIGNADTIIDQGPHTYVIHYGMTRMARFFADHDEVYWNATGNYWDFPMLKATATLTLPAGAKISELAAYTGPVGSDAHDATIQQNGDNAATFVATNVLQPGEGMTIAAAFQKGIVVPPAGTGQGLDWLSDHRELVLPPLMVLLVLGYNLLAWNRVGRDPRRGTVIPLFHPPADLSPAMTQWVHRMGFKGNGWQAFTAGVFDLGVKGLVTIDNSGTKPTVTATDTPLTQPLSADEQVLYEFFGTGSKTLDKSIGPTLDKKRQAMLAAITSPNRGVYFRGNWLPLLGSIALGLISMGIMVLLEVLDPTAFFVVIIAGAFVAVLGFFLRAAGLRSVGGVIVIIIEAIICAILALAWLGTAELTKSPQLGMLAAGIIVLVTVLFAFLMRAPTETGRRIMDQIDGFLMYMNTAEKNRLNLDKEPPMTIKRFEALLPFAIALGVERPWSDRFNAALAANQVSDADGIYYTPLWYSGGNFNSSNLSNSIAAITTGMSVAMASAVPSQSSSSGFSGGSSGGGGGGGGGGGW